MGKEVVVGDFELTMNELRTVARYVVESAEEVLPHFSDAHPEDSRPRTAIDAAWEFISGSPRTKLQRVASLDAHRAAREATTEVSTLAARCAGDAAAAAYLHPIAKAHQQQPRQLHNGTCHYRFINPDLLVNSEPHTFETRTNR